MAIRILTMQTCFMYKSDNRRQALSFHYKLQNTCVEKNPSPALYLFLPI